MVNQNKSQPTASHNFGFSALYQEQSSAFAPTSWVHGHTFKGLKANPHCWGHALPIKLWRGQNACPKVLEESCGAEVGISIGSSCTVVICSGTYGQFTRTSTSTIAATPCSLLPHPAALPPSTQPPPLRLPLLTVATATWALCSNSCGGRACDTAL